MLADPRVTAVVVKHRDGLGRVNTVLLARSAAFRRQDSQYTVIWEIALLGECTARLIGACTLPVTTTTWLGGGRCSTWSTGS